MDKKVILWLTEWFPTDLVPYSGDSIERKAIAASNYNNIIIVFVKKREGLAFGKILKEERIYNDHCKAHVYYYPSIWKTNKYLDLLLSNYYFLTLHLRAIRKIKKAYGKPDGIQVNVTMKNGIIALYCKWFKRIKYIVVEDWSGFLQEAKPHFKEKPLIFKFLARMVLKNSSLLVTVSRHLADTMCNTVVNKPTLVIPNVVDKDNFYPNQSPFPRSTFKFIHISSLDYPKNFELILQAFKKVAENGYNVELTVHGPDSMEIKKMTNELGLGKVVLYKDEMPQIELAESLRASHCLILYSRYETFGNVVIEANACGLPVIVSDYPTFKENVIENLTGLVAQNYNPEMLADKMVSMILNYQQFDGSKIAQMTIEKFGYDVIGKKFDEVYSKLF